METAVAESVTSLQVHDRPVVVPHREKLRGWRRIACAVWGAPRDPQIYGWLDVDATPLLDLIARSRGAGVQMTITHLVGRAIAHGLAAVPDVNVRIVGGKAIPISSVEVFFITAVGGGRDLSGVKVKNADRKSAKEIAEEVHRDARLLKSGKDKAFARSKKTMDALPMFVLRPVLRFIAWLAGTRGRRVPLLGVDASPFGSAMVSSVGMFGLPNGFSPIAWLYHVPILVLAGELADKPIAVDGKVEIRPVLPICVSLDHRYMDGWHIGRLTRAFREYLTHPERFEPAV